MDYTQRSIRQLCQLYGQADRGLEMVEGREARQKLHAEIKAISDEAQRRDEKYAELVSAAQEVLDSRDTYVASMEAELEKAQQINFDLIETIAQLSEKLTLEADDGMTEADWQMAEEDWQLTEDEIEI